MARSSRTPWPFVVVLFSPVLWGAEQRKPQKKVAPETVRTIPEVFRTPNWPGADVDSVALWRDGKGGALLFVTAKQANVVYVCNGVTGALVSTMGKGGKGQGEFLRPNGVVVADDYLFVTERDNHRISVFDLPSLNPVLTFGREVLLLPYGATAFHSGDRYSLYVTDNYPAGSLRARVKHFTLMKANGALEAKLVRSFGDPKGPGALPKVESILADPARDRLFVCDEAGLDVKVYDLAGQFTGISLGKKIIKYEPEGMVLFEDRSVPSRGWLMVTDQGLKQTVLRVFERDNGRYVGAVTGSPILANTDGIALSPGDLGPFKRGALYCVHDDTRVQAYSWADVETALGLHERP